MINRRNLLGGALLGCLGAKAANATCFVPAFEDCFGSSVSFSPSLDLNFLGGSLDPRISFTRASNATYFDATGTLQTASSNVPRFDYDPVSLAPRGLLIEEQRTNSVRNPRCEGAVPGVLGGYGGGVPTYWSQGVITAQTVTVVGTGVESGIPYIDLKIDSSGAGGNRIQFDNPPWNASTTFACSLYARLIAGSFSGFSAFVFRTISLPASTMFSNDLSGITSAPLATQRFSHNGTSGSSDTNIRPEISWSTTGAGSVTIRIGGPQLEQGSFPTSLILPPAGSPAATTRAGDVPSIAAGSWFNPNAGTLIDEVIIPSPTTANRSHWSLDNGTPSNRLMVYQNAGTERIAVVDIVGASTVWNVNLGSLTLGVPARTGIAWAPGGTAGIVNGGAISTSSAATPSAMTTLRLGNDVASLAKLNGWLRKLRYWPRALSNAELQRVTSP